MKKAEYNGQIGYYDEMEDKFYPETSLKKAEYEGKKGLYHAESDSFHPYDFGESKTLQSKKPDVNPIPEKYTAEYALKSAAQVGASLIEPIAGTYGWVKKAAQQYILPSIYGKADIVEMRNSMQQAQADYEKLQKKLLGETTPTAESFMNDIFAPIIQQIKGLRETFGIPQSDAEVKKGSMDEKWQAAADLIENTFMTLGMTEGAIHSAKPMMSRFEKLKANVAQEASQRGEHKKAADIYNQMMKDNPELASKVTKDVTDKAKVYMQDAKKNLQLTYEGKGGVEVSNKTLEVNAEGNVLNADGVPMTSEEIKISQKKLSEKPKIGKKDDSYVKSVDAEPAEVNPEWTQRVLDIKKQNETGKEYAKGLADEIAQQEEIVQKTKEDIKVSKEEGQSHADFMKEQIALTERIVEGQKYANYLSEELVKANETNKIETPVEGKTSVAEVIKNEEKSIDTSSAEKEMPALKESNHIVKLYNELANQQRNKPETSMLNVPQQGVINIIEDIGDLNHRMNESNSTRFYGTDKYSLMDYGKIDKALRVLGDEYGFRREYNENIKEISQNLKIDEKIYRKKVEKALKEYAEAHRELKVYTTPQKIAQDAAIAMGELRFEDAYYLLKDLKKYKDSPELFREAQYNPIIEESKPVTGFKKSEQPIEEIKTNEGIKSSEETKTVDEPSIIEQGRDLLRQHMMEEKRIENKLPSKNPLTEKDINWLKENKDVLLKNSDELAKKDIERLHDITEKEDVKVSGEETKSIEVIPQKETFTEKVTSEGEIKKLTPEEEKIKAFIDVEHNDASEEAKQSLFEKMTSDKFKKGRESILKRIDADENLYTKIQNKMKESKNTFITDEMKAASDAYFKDTSTLKTGLDPEGIKHLGIIAGYYIEKGARNFDAFAKIMVKQYGEVVIPHLQKAWDEALSKTTKKQGSLEPSKISQIFNIISSPNRILEKSLYPLARKLAKRVVDAQTFKDIDRVAEYKKLDKILKPIGHDEKLHEQVFNLLNKFISIEDIQKAEGYSPKAIQAASGMREWFQDMLHKLQEANVTDKEGNKITDFGAYVTHIKESSAFPKEIKQIVNELFSGQTTSDIYGTGVEDVMGWRRKKQTPLFSSAEKRLGDIEHLEKDMHRIARSYLESAMVVLHDKPVILEGREIIKNMKEGYIKNIATDYLGNFAHTMMEMDTTFKKLDNAFARIGARNVIPFNTKVQMLHLGRLIVMGMPEMGIFTTIDSMGRVMLNPKEAYRKVHNAGILQADIVPWAFKHAGEQFAQIGNFFDAGNTAAKIILYDALERKINKMHPELSAEERQLKTIQEVIRIEGVVTGANRNLLLAKTPKSFAQYKNWVQKTLENYRYAVEDVFTPGISKKQRMQNALKVTRYAAMGYAAIKITEETGIQLFHLSGKSLKLGSTTLTYMGKIVDGLGKNDLEKVALDTIKFFTPAYNSLSNEWKKGGTAIDKSQKHSALVVPDFYTKINPETLKRTLGIAGIGVVGMIVGKSSELAYTLPKEGWFKGEDRMMKYELTDTSSLGKTSALKENIVDQFIVSKKPLTKTGKLSELWEPTSFDTKDTTLLDYYPNLKDVKLIINYTPKKFILEESISSGSLSSEINVVGNKQFKIYATGNNIGVINQTILHEIQHWIQEKELFARGGNPENFKHLVINQMIDESAVFKKAIEKHNELYDKYRKEMLKQNATSLDTSKIPYLLKQEQILEASLLQIDKIRDAEYSRIKKQHASYIDTQAYLYYEALAGEIEARDTAERMRMTPEQRKHDPVYSSTSIPRERWIQR